MAKRHGLFGGAVAGFWKNGVGRIAGRLTGRGGGVGALVEAMEGRQMMSAVPAWVNTFGSQGAADDFFSNNTVYDVVTDAAKNIYVAGSFRGTVDFDFGAGTEELTATYGMGDGYVAKYSSDGSLEWITQFKATGGDGVGFGGSAGRALSLDGSGNLYIAGTFTDSVNVAFETGSKAMTSTGEMDIFMARVSTGGNLDVIKQFYGLGSQNIYQFVGSQDGGITIMGVTTGAMDLDLTSKEVDLDAAKVGGTSFVARYDTAMNLISYVATRGTGSGSSNFSSVDFVPGTKTLIVAANAQGTGEIFGSGGVLGTITASTVGAETFVASINMAGVPAVNWGKSIASTETALVGAVTVDKEGNVYLGMNVTGKADLNPALGTSPDAVAFLDAGLQAQVVVVSLDADGFYRGKAATGGEGIGHVRDMIVKPDPADANKSVVVIVGTFEGTMQFDPAGSDGGKFTSASPAGFVWQLRADGTFLSGSGLYANANGIGDSKTGSVDVLAVAAVSGADALVLGGVFQGEADFDASTGTKIVDSVSNGSASDVFFGRFDRKGTADQVNETVTAAPQISVKALGVSISNNDLTPSTTDGTDFGVYTVGTTATSVTFTVTNTGTAAMTLSDFTRPLGYGLADALTTTLNAGQSDTFTLTFGPSLEGMYGGTVSFKTNVAGMETFAFAITGKTAGSTDPGELTPGIKVAFGDVEVADGDSTPSAGEGTLFAQGTRGVTGPTATFTITNDGTGELEVGTIALPSGFVLVDGITGSLGAGESDSITVRLNTSTVGKFAGDISIATNVTGENPFNFRVQGEVVEPAPVFTLEVTTPDGAVTDGMGVFAGTHFGNESYVGGDAVVRTFTVTNTGTGALTLGALVLPAGLKVVDGLVASLLPGKSDTFSLKLETTSARVLTGSVSFATNVPGQEKFDFAVAGTVQAHKAGGGTYVFDAKSVAASRTFIDELGNKVVFAPTGAGQVTVQQSGTGALISVTMKNTDIKSGLTVTVTKDAKIGTSTGVTSVGSVEIEGAFGAFTASKMNLTDGFGVDGAIKAITLNDVVGGDQQTIELGGTATDKTALTFGRMQDVTISTGASVTALKALEWQDMGGAVDGLSAAKLGALTISGRAANAVAKVTKLDGDFDGAITLTGAASGTTVMTSTITVAGAATGIWNFGAHKAVVTIKGGVSNGTWIGTGGFGGISVGGSVSGLILNSSKDVGAMTVKGGVMDSGFFVGGNLTSFAVGGLMTHGSVEVVGKAGGMTLGAVEGVSFNLKGDAASFTSKTTVVTSNLTVGGNLGAVKTTAWQGGVMNVTGKVAGVTVSGRVHDNAAWSAGKGFGAISIGDDTIGLKVQASGGIASFKAVQVVDSELKALGAIGAVNVVDWTGGEIGGSKIASVTATGRAVLNAKGDFDADVIVSGAGFTNKTAVLGAVNIAGKLGDSEWEITGKTGAISVGALANTQISATGDVASFTSKGAVTDSNVHSDGVMGAVTALKWTGGSIHADKVASITTKGQAATKTAAAIAGDFEGVVVVSGEGLAATALALGNVTVAGSLVNSQVLVSGNAGVVTVGAMDHSVLFAGVSPLVDPSGLPVSKTQFVVMDSKTGALSKLGGLVVTGKGVASGASFVNSRVAAGTLTNVSLKLVEMNEELVNGFVAGVKIGAYSRLTGLPKPGDVVKVSNKTAAGVYDGSGEEGFGLRIV